LREEFLPQIEEQYKESLEWKELNTSEDNQALSLIIALSGQFGLEEALIPSILVGDAFLVGAKNIKNGLEPAIKIAVEVKRVQFLFKD